MTVDFTVLKPLEQPSRRSFFIATSLMAGYTLAAGPLQAQTMIKTPADGLVEGQVMIPATGGEMPAYRAMPADGIRFPTVLVVQEVFGVHEHIKDLCRRLAQLGYLAIAADLYARQADMSKVTTGPAAMEVATRVPDAQVMADLDSAAAWAKASGKMDGDRLAVTGFCWGGRIVWLYAAHNPRLKAGVAWYGPLDWQKSDLQPKNPADVVGELKAPVLGLYGEADSFIPMASIEKLRGQLKAAGRKDMIVTYPDTPHGFNADYRASYRQAAAEDGWKRMQAWFKAHGV